VFSHRAFRTMFEQSALDVAILDPMRVGGITGFLRVARTADAFGIPVATHAYGELGSQLIPALPNGLVVEHLGEVSSQLMEEDLQPAGGLVVASDRPGIGIHFDAEALGRLRTSPPPEDTAVTVETLRAGAGR
jgi:L-alanine-DL-glutamate epimerase-like enolase superfamily enzyme